MMAATALKFLNHGLYSVPEASVYARVHPSLLSSWVFGTKRSRSVISQEIVNKDKIVSFLDLIQTLAIRQIRIQKGVPLEKFRQAIAYAKKKFKMDHPFARQHCTYWDGSELIIRPKPDETDFIEASGRQRGQRLFSFVENYLDDLAYDPNGLVEEYRIFKSKAGVAITMNPLRRFGEPLLPSGYTPWALWDAIQSEGSLHGAAQDYGVPVEEAAASYEFIDYLGRKAA